MKKPFCVILILVIVLFAAPKLWAECKISNLSLKKDSVFTTLTIYADAPFEYEHFTLEPKEGKPYRVVVDIADANHNLPRNSFLDIPSKTITGIRTSQYKTEPNVVRIVLDLKEPIVYKTEKEKENELNLVVSTPQDSDFSFWIAVKVPSSEEEPKLAQIPQAIKGPTEEVSIEEKAASTTKEVQATQPRQIPQVEKEEIKQEVPIKEKEVKPAVKVAQVDKKPTKAPIELKQQAKSVREETKLGEAKRVSETQSAGQTLAKEKEVSQPAAKKVEVKKQTQAAPATKVAEKAEQLGSKEQAEVGETEQGVSARTETAASQPETSKVDQLKRKVEDQAKSIKTQADMMTPRGEVIDTIYRRKVITYETGGKKDPFTPIGERINIEFGKTPQPAYESLKLVGILKDASGNIALLEDGEGYGYIMREGDKVRNGEVIYVGDNKILFQITEYGWSKTVSMELSQEKK